MKIIPFITIAILECVSSQSLVWAQQTPAPSAPYLARAPNPSTWILEPDPSSATATPGALRVLSISVTKNGTVRREVTTLSNGTSDTCWYIGSARYVYTGPDGWAKYDARENPELGNYGAADFTELGFVTISNFQKVEPKAGHTCFFYVAPANGSTVDNPEKAWIDVTSRLPVARETGGQLWLYRFLPPPAEKLAVPPVLIELAGREYKP